MPAVTIPERMGTETIWRKHCMKVSFVTIPERMGTETPFFEEGLHS